MTQKDIEQKIGQLTLRRTENKRQAAILRAMLADAGKVLRSFGATLEADPTEAVIPDVLLGPLPFREQIDELREVEKAIMKDTDCLSKCGVD